MPASDKGLSTEVRAALRQAHDRPGAEHEQPVILRSWQDSEVALIGTAAMLGNLVAELRAPDNGEKGWRSELPK